MKLSLSFGHRFSELALASADWLPGWLPASLAFAKCGFSGFQASRPLAAALARSVTEFLPFLIKHGTQSGRRLDNYIFHIVQIANDCCCGNLITAHLMKRQLMLHVRTSGHTPAVRRVKACQGIWFIIYDNCLGSPLAFAQVLIETSATSKQSPTGRYTARDTVWPIFKVSEWILKIFCWTDIQCKSYSYQLYITRLRIQFSIPHLPRVTSINNQQIKFHSTVLTLRIRSVGHSNS